MPQPYVYHTSSLYVSSYFFIHVPLCPCRRNTGFPPRLKANQLYTLERLEQMVKMRRAQIKCAQWWTSAKWRGGGGIHCTRHTLWSWNLSREQDPFVIFPTGSVGIPASPASCWKKRQPLQTELNPVKRDCTIDTIREHPISYIFLASQPKSIPVYRRAALFIYSLSRRQSIGPCS